MHAQLLKEISKLSQLGSEWRNISKIMEKINQFTKQQSLRPPKTEAEMCVYCE